MRKENIMKYFGMSYFGKRKLSRLSDATREAIKKALEILDANHKRKREREENVNAVNDNNDKKHDFRTFRKHKTNIYTEIKNIEDTGFTETERHKRLTLSEKRLGRKYLSKEDIFASRGIFFDESITCFNERFKIVTDMNRNRRKKFAHRSNFAASIYLILGLFADKLLKKSVRTL